MLLGMYAHAPQAKALTLDTITYSGGNTAFYTSATISTNVPSYAPGDQITITSSYDVEANVPGSIYKAGMSVAYPAGPTFDTDLGVTGSAPAFNYREVRVQDMPRTTPLGSITLTIPSNISAGNHFLSNRLTSIALDSNGASVPGTTDGVAVGRLNFTVTAPASIDLNFSR
jgi:hypothetical protein